VRIVVPVKRLLILFILLCASPLYAATYYASPAGTGSAPCGSGDPCSFTDARDEATSGDIIQLQDGTYNLTLRLLNAQSGVTLRGGPGVILHGGGDDIPDGQTEGIYLPDSASHDITIDGQGMVFDGQGVAGCGIQVYGTNHLIQDFDIGFSGSHGVCGNPVTNHFLRVTVHHSGVDADLHRTLGCFDGVTDCSGFGSQQACRDALFDPNEHGHCHGVYFFSGSSGTGSNTFEACTFRQSDGYGIHSYDGGNIVKGSKIHDNASAGLSELGCSGGGATVQNSIFYGNNWSVGGWALNLGCSTAKAYNNTIANNSDVGLEIGHASTTARNNLFYNNGGNNLQNSSSSSNLSGNFCGGTGGTTDCDATGDPEFADETGRNYHISTTGDAAGVGDDLSGLFTIDYDGSTRTQWDAGAYLAGGSPPPAETTGLVAFFKLDNDFTDSSGLNHNLTANGSWAANDAALVDSDLGTGGIQGFSAIADGVDDNATVAHADLRPTTSVKLSAWVKTSGNADPICRIISADTNPTSPYILGYREADGFPFCDANGVAVVGSVSIMDDALHHLACGKDGSNLKLYVDNSLVNTTAIGGTMSYSGSEVFAIGGVSGRQCQADLDHIKVSANEDLTAAQVNDLFLENEQPPAGGGAAPYLMATGSYAVGGSASDDRDITISPAFTPEVVVIKCDGAVEAVWTIAALLTSSTTFSNTAVPATNRIQAFNADGFQVGTSTSVQNLNSTCYYTAFANGPGNGLAVGTYTGNGSDDRDITISPAFSPQMVWIHYTAGVTQSGVWRSTAHTGDDASKFAASTANLANAIQGFHAAGFTVGTDGTTNTNTATYAYVAFKAVTDYNDTGTFTGDGSTVDDRDIASINTPTFGFIKTARSTSAGPACARWGGVAGDLSWRVDATAPAANNIQAFQTTGFQVGTTTCSNDNAQSLYWWMTKTPASAATRQRLRSVQ
jgi:concanavalin A-like lectin/glucanase superfamily protein